MAPSDIQTPIAIGYSEAERQAAEVAALRTMLDASEKCFSLSIAVCNSPALRDFVIGEGRASLPGIRVVSVPKGHVDVFGFVAGEVDGSACAALFVVNLEASIDSTQEDQPTLRSLNASRELWQRFACPVVFWLPEYAATLTATHAPDFWRYRSHRFEFVSEQAGATVAMAEPYCRNDIAAGNLSAAEKRFRIAELEARLADAGASPPRPLEYYCAVWLNELGFLYSFLGELDAAERASWKALRIIEKLGRPQDLAYTYGNLGAIYGRKGNLDQAEGMHRKSLEIEESLGDFNGMASECLNLGIVYQTRGELDQAEQMFFRALEIHERGHQLAEMAKDYRSLGTVYYHRDELDRAEWMLRKSLEIEEKLGRQQGLASNYGNLGLVYEKQGELDRAEQMLCRALQIEKSLGNLGGMSIAYGNLGLVYRRRGDLDHAEEMLRQSLEIEEALGSLPGLASAYSNLGLIAAQRGNVALARSLWLKASELIERIGDGDWRAQVQTWLEGLPREGKV